MSNGTLFDIPVIPWAERNPMLKFGRGPAGKRCKECRHLFSKHYGNTYHKCRFRFDTNGPGTDHRVNWAACVKFEQKIT